MENDRKRTKEETKKLRKICFEIFFWNILEKKNSEKFKIKKKKNKKEGVKIFFGKPSERGVFSKFIKQNKTRNQKRVLPKFLAKNLICSSKNEKNCEKFDNKK